MTSKYTLTTAQKLPYIVVAGGKYSEVVVSQVLR